MTIPDMVLVPREFIEFVKNAPVSSGLCCCGNRLDYENGCGDHPPVDQWDYALSKWLKEMFPEPLAVDKD